jgi:Fe-S oxidoreductase
LASEEFKQIADLCVNCHQCRAECPAEVDIPKLMVECKGQYVATNGVPWRDWLFTHLDSVAQWCSPFSSVANWAIGNRLMRWLGEKTLGLAQGRKLPRLSLRSYLRRAARRRLTRPSRAQNRKVVYFVDTYANWFDTELAEAFVAVLEHNGISVYVPAGQLHSAMPLIALGSLEKAKDVAKRNVRLLADAIRQGYEVVATEPSAALALSHEYPNLLDDDETRLVAAHSSEGCSYLWKLHLEGKLELDLKPINLSVAYHEPCHIRALQDFSAGENLLRLIPGLVVQRVEKGCSGMAGTFGLQSENYRTSLRVGWELISSIRHSTAQMGTTECSACKIQMEQGTTKPTLHPLKLLAVSYGVIADGNRLLARSSQELYVS